MTDLTLIVIPELFAWIGEHWEAVAGAVGTVVVVIGIVYGLRTIERQQIHKTYAENIKALNELIATHEKTIALQHTEIDEKDFDVTRLTAEVAAVRSEYKIVAGIVLSDIVAFESNRIEHLARQATLLSETNILRAQIVNLETRLIKQG